MNHTPLHLNPDDRAAFERYEAFEALAIAAQRYEDGVDTLEKVREAAQGLLEHGDLNGLASQMIDDLDHVLGNLTQEAA
ncbi:MAG: hypothetical protein ACYTGQ_05105 [Planctomycetota bacterium]